MLGSLGPFPACSLSDPRLQGNVHVTLKVSWWCLLCGLCRESMVVDDGQLLKVFSGSSVYQA